MANEEVFTEENEPQPGEDAVTPEESLADRRNYILEVLIVVMLGITALLTAWASWQDALHSGNQASNYTQSNNLAAEGNSEYNAGVQTLMQDMLAYNEYNSMNIDYTFAEESGNALEMERLEWKLDEFATASISPELMQAIEWAWDQSDNGGQTVSPFDQEGFTDSYFTAANDLLAQSQEKLSEGEADNKRADSFGLVTVIYSVVLFLLGIAGTFKGSGTKMAVVVVSLVAFVLASGYMLMIPLPTGFDIMSFFNPGS
jgi:hypothetical protein